MYKIKVHLKNGKEIEFRAKSFNFEWSSTTGEFVGYEYKGITSHNELGIVLSEIVAYEAWEMTTDEAVNTQEKEGVRVG